MAEAKTIARPYAEAVFALAREQKALAVWSDMLALAAAVTGDEQVRRLAADPRIDPGQLLGLILAVCGDKLSRDGQNFVRVLVDNRRLPVLPEIIEVFEELKNAAESRVEAFVQSAFPMSPEQIRALEQGLARKLAREVKVTVEVEPALIGGTVVHADDLVIDASVRGRLQQMAASLNT